MVNLLLGGRKADNYGCLLSLFNPFVTVKAVNYYL